MSLRTLVWTSHLTWRHTDRLQASGQVVNLVAVGAACWVSEREARSALVRVRLSACMVHGTDGR